MLDRMIATFPHVAAFFYDKDGHEKSDRALEALETIDDDIQVNTLSFWRQAGSYSIASWCIFVQILYACKKVETGCFLS